MSEPMRKALEEVARLKGERKRYREEVGIMHDTKGRTVEARGGGGPPHTHTPQCRVHCHSEKCTNKRGG